LLRAEQSRALLDPMETITEIGYNTKVEGDVIVTRRDAALGWFRKGLDAGADDYLVKPFSTEELLAIFIRL